MKLSEMQVKVMCCDVRMRSVFFFPLESNSDFPQHDWCKHQYTHFYCYSLRQHKGHTWRGERRREESNQPKCIHITHTRTPHTHHVWSQWAKEVYWSFQQEEVEWKQEKNNSEVMKQGHRFNCIDVFCGDRNISVPLLSGSSDIWPLYSCWRVKISEILRPRGFILCAHAESLKNMTWLLPALSSPCSPDS